MLQGTTDEIILYHGSYCEVQKPLLAKCAQYKDFGRGFYLTSSLQQAEAFLKTSIGKAEVAGLIDVGQKYGYISKFAVHMNPDLLIFNFPNADSEWLHCVATHRRKNIFPEIIAKYSKYDIISGKIADDQTNTALAAYISGALGEFGSLETDNYCIKMLLPEKLKDQFCFKTEKALNCLEFIGSEKKWLTRL